MSDLMVSSRQSESGVSATIKAPKECADVVVGFTADDQGVTGQDIVHNRRLVLETLPQSEQLLIADSEDLYIGPQEVDRLAASSASPCPEADKIVAFQGFKFYEEFFSRGLVYAVTSDSDGVDGHVADRYNLRFSLGGRKLIFTKKSEVKPHAKQSRTMARALNDIYGKIDDYDSDDEEIIVNQERRQEIFYPLRGLGLYVYPWLSKTQMASREPENALASIRQFYMVGCMFGAEIYGTDVNANKIQLVKHDIKLFPGQRIENVPYYPDSRNPYEYTLFKELENQTKLIEKISSREANKILCYHLPYYDYMLFGIELFMQGKMASVALVKFFKAIFFKQQDYRAKIQRICDRSGIAVIIASPFENLFGPLEQKINPKNILTKIGLNLDEEYKIAAASQSKEATEREAALVRNCLDKLRTNNHNELHRKVWNDFLIAAGNVENLEELFKTSNAVMLGIACQGRQDYETCTLLPITEKQITLSYEKIIRLIRHERYPGVVNLTTMEPVISHDEHSKGILFYFNARTQVLSETLIDKRLLDVAHKNLSSGYAGEQPTKLRDLLANKL